MKIIKQINWPTAIVLVVVLVLIWVTAVFGRQMGLNGEMHDEFLAGLGSLGAIGAALLPRLRKEFMKDTDGDGLPDPLDAKPDEPAE